MTHWSHKLMTSGLAMAMEAPPEGVFGALVGSTLPDIDIPLGIPHRTWTHWWPMYAIPALVMSVIPPVGPASQMILSFLKWICIGAMLHIAEDSLTVGGVPVVLPKPITVGPDGHPWKTGVMKLTPRRKFSFKLTKTGGFLEVVLTIVIIVLAARVVVATPGYREKWTGFVPAVADAFDDKLRNGIGYMEDHM